MLWFGIVFVGKFALIWWIVRLLASSPPVIGCLPYFQAPQNFNGPR